MPVWGLSLEALTLRTPPAMPASPHQPASPSASVQRGGLAMPIMLSVLVLAASTLALQAAKQTRRPLEEQRTTEARMKRIEGALKAYAILNKQLPCPANGTLDIGLSEPLSPTPCSMPADGTVPWATLGLQQDDAFDSWGRKISYRVFAGNTPLLYPTQLSVNDAGATKSDVAWVLISHGPTGYGAWLPKGNSPNPAQQMPLPSSVATPSFNPDEFENTKSAVGTEFVKKPPKVVDLLPTQVAFFDDVVRYKTLGNLKAETGLLGVAPNAAPITLDTTTLATSGVTFTGFASSQQTLTIPASGTAPGMTLAVQSGQQIAFDNTGSPKTGMGVCGASGPCNAANAELSGSETLSFKLVRATAVKLGVLFENFSVVESAQITFQLGGVQVGAVLNHVGTSNAIDLVPTVASAAFDEVVIGAGGTSSFFIDAVRFCDATTPCTP